MYIRCTVLWCQLEEGWKSCQFQLRCSGLLHTVYVLSPPWRRPKYHGQTVGRIFIRLQAGTRELCILQLTLRQPECQYNYSLNVWGTNLSCHSMWCSVGALMLEAVGRLSAMGVNWEQPTPLDQLSLEHKACLYSITSSTHLIILSKIVHTPKLIFMLTQCIVIFLMWILINCNGVHQNINLCDVIPFP